MSHKNQSAQEEEKSTDSSSFSLSGPTRELTNLELIRKAEDCVEKLKLEKAVSLFDEGIRRFPNDTIIIDQYTDLLIQFGETAKAKEVSHPYNKTHS